MRGEIKYYCLTTGKMCWFYHIYIWIIGLYTHTHTHPSSKKYITSTDLNKNTLLVFTYVPTIATWLILKKTIKLKEIQWQDTCCIAKTKRQGPVCYKTYLKILNTNSSKHIRMDIYVNICKKNVPNSNFCINLMNIYWLKIKKW